MRTGFKTYASYSLAFGLAVALGGCGKKDKKDDAAAAADPDTWVTDSSVDGGVAKIKYKSSDANAKFKCQLEAEGQKDAPWSDCPAEGASLPVEAGVRYTFRVKAVGATGAEDKEPYTYTFVGGPGSASTGQQPELLTVILGKDEIDATYDKTELALELGIEGGPSVDDVRFECKRENERSFRRCRTTKSNTFEDSTYTFTELKDGNTYALAVRAVMKEGGAVAAEDEITFRVELSDFPIEGEDQLRTQTSGRVTLRFPPNALCTIDAQEPFTCGAMQHINLDDPQLVRGNHSLTVEIAGGLSKQIPFCVGTCVAAPGSNGGVRPAAPVVTEFPLGSFYVYDIPEGMHVVNYSTTKTTNDSVYWLRALNDPLSNDLDACLNNDLPHPVPGREFTMLTPSGDSMNYCATTPTRQTYKAKTEGRRALNHLELATDVELVLNQLKPRDERIAFNVFDSDTEWMVDATTFARLCSNRNGDLHVAGPFWVIGNDFYGAPVRTELFSCLADLVEFIQDPATGAVVPVSARWWVGSFFLSSDDLELPSVMCMDRGRPGYDAGQCDGYWGRRMDMARRNSCKNPSLVEATIMIRQDSRYGVGPRSVISDYSDFSRAAQSFFINNFNEIVPVAN